MSPAPRILNITKNCYLKRSQAERAVEACSCAWVEFGKTVRSLNLAESIQARKQQAKERELLETAELPGIKYQPPIGAQAAHYIERQRAFEANQFYVLAIQ